MKRFNHLNVPKHWEHYWSKYPEGYTILEALLNWVKQVNDMVDSYEDLQNNYEIFKDGIELSLKDREERLDSELDSFEKEFRDFINTFDNNLRDEVMDVLSDWQDTGFIDIVISDALDTQVRRLKQVDNVDNGGLEQAGAPLNVESAIGNNLTTHGSVVDFGAGELWRGYRYWMAHTPYPGTFNENPSIAASNDNRNFVLPEGARNPLVDTPSGAAYYSDTELIYIPDDDVLRMYYREANTPSGFVNLWYIESSDGVQWTEPQITYSSDELMLLSPAILIDKIDGLFKMWFVEDSNNLGYMTSINGTHWENLELIKQPFDSISLWHIGVDQTENGTVHLMGGADSNTDMRAIYYCYSPLGQTSFIANNTPQLIPSGYFGGYLYRPSFYVVEDNGDYMGQPYVKLWYSASNDSIAAAWYMAFTEGFLTSNGDNSSFTSVNTTRKKFGDFFKVMAGRLITPFAEVSRLLTKRIVLKSDYSQPLMEFYDGRPNRDGGNYMRLEYQGSERDNDIRLFMTYFNDDGTEYKRIGISPFLGNIHIGGMSLHGANVIGGDEAVISEGLRLESTNGEYVRLVTDSSNNLQIQLVGGEFRPQFRSTDGRLNMDGAGVYNAQNYGITGKTSISNAPNGTIFEDSDGKLKYKNQTGEVTVLT